VNSVLSHYSWCHSCLYKFTSMVDRYFYDCLELARSRRWAQICPVELSWVEMSWVGLSCVVSVDMHSALQAVIKSQMDNNLTAKGAYNAEVNQLSVADTAITPPLSTVESILQRHKVKTRLPLPATRQDLALPASYTTTTNGRPFKLIDDGQADRINDFRT